MLPDWKMQAGKTDKASRGIGGREREKEAGCWGDVGETLGNQGEMDVRRPTRSGKKKAKKRGEVGGRSCQDGGEERKKHARIDRCSGRRFVRLILGSLD